MDAYACPSVNGMPATSSRGGSGNCPFLSRFYYGRSVTACFAVRKLPQLPVHLQSVKEGLRGDIAVGSQDCWVQGNGAFTGETSADMLTDMGVGWVVIGHSERRGKGESDAEVAQKAKYALDNGLSVIACCGEPQENREAGTTNEFVFPQIKAYADAFSKEDWARVVIAYEPICKFLCKCIWLFVYYSP
jgi:triosephosphate isomerase